VWSRASSFKWEYPLLSLRSSSSFLRLLPRLHITSIPPFIFPSVTRCRRHFLHIIWPIQLAFRLLISCRIFLCSLTVSNTSSFLTRSVQLIFSILLQHHISKLSRCFWSKTCIHIRKRVRAGKYGRTQTKRRWIISTQFGCEPTHGKGLLWSKKRKWRDIQGRQPIRGNRYA
jgi:hypothetical protein